MITTVTLNPAVDKTVEIDNFKAGSVNRIQSVRLDAGGKGINVSKVVAGFGGSSRAIGILAGKAGNFIKDYLDSEGIENDFIFIKGETRINIKIVDSVNHLNTDINEPGASVTSEDMINVRNTILKNIDNNSIVVFSGSIPTGIDKSIYRELIDAAKQKGAKTILDADGDLLKYGIEAGPYIIKPNIHELERLFNMKLDNIEELIKLTKTLKEKHFIEIAAVSLGEKGAIFINKGSVILAEGIPVEVKSTVGAGDAMVAALAYALDNELSFEEAAILAVAAGTANVMTTGTQPADQALINELKNKVKLTYLDY